MVDVLDFPVGEFGVTREGRIDEKLDSGCDTCIDHCFSFIDFLINEFSRQRGYSFVPTSSHSLLINVLPKVRHGLQNAHKIPLSS